MMRRLPRARAASRSRPLGGCGRQFQNPTAIDATPTIARLPARERVRRHTAARRALADPAADEGSTLASQEPQGN